MKYYSCILLLIRSHLWTWVKICNLLSDQIILQSFFVSYVLRLDGWTKYPCAKNTAESRNLWFSTFHPIFEDKPPVVDETSCDSCMDSSIIQAPKDSNKSLVLKTLIPKHRETCVFKKNILLRNHQVKFCAHWPTTRSGTLGNHP